MSVIQKFLGKSPFSQIVEHTKKVHECVEMLRPLTEAIFEGNHERVEELHHEMSRTEHEADQIKIAIRDQLASSYLLSVGRPELMRFLTYQDDVADSAEDFAVVALIRKTTMPEELREDFMAFVEQVIKVSEHLLELAEELSLVAESAFSGKEAEKILQGVDQISQEEWKADKLQRKFSRHSYAIEDQLDPTTLRFYDKYCMTLSDVANSAEKTAKDLHQIILGR